jgi:phenylalanine-4-hydroxylase
MKELLLYGLAKDETRDYMEQLLLSHVYSMDKVNEVIQLAKKEGWHSFRVATFNMSNVPDFVSTLTI